METNIFNIYLKFYRISIDNVVFKKETGPSMGRQSTWTNSMVKEQGPLGY